MYLRESIGKDELRVITVHHNKHNGKICEEYELAGIVNGAPVELYAWKEDGKYYCQNASNFKVTVNESLKKEKCYEDYLMNLAFKTINESTSMNLREFGKAVAAKLSKHTNTDWDFADVDTDNGTVCITLSDTNDDHYTFCKNVKELSDTEAKNFALAFEDYINSGEEPDEVDESLTEAVHGKMLCMSTQASDAVPHAEGVVFLDNGAYDLEQRGISGSYVWVGYEHTRSRARNSELANSLYDVSHNVADWFAENNGGAIKVHIDDFMNSMDMYRIWASAAVDESLTEAEERGPEDAVLYDHGWELERERITKERPVSAIVAGWKIPNGAIIKIVPAKETKTDESLTEAVEDPFETLIDNVYEVIEYEHLWAELTDRRVTGDKLKLAYEVNGDWKHEHLRFSNCIMPKCCEDLGLVIEKHWESDVEDNDSDTYWSIHNFVISKGRGLRNVQQSL